MKQRFDFLDYHEHVIRAQRFRYSLAELPRYWSANTAGLTLCVEHDGHAILDLLTEVSSHRVSLMQQPTID